ncbi:uncharacterized protein [Halyomorpha halys]|uniref:uncharacterized protein n=1 Tax=Halyomorpha halys TaxID=286706 RepID=UPI0006D50883|nr:uncharacterized protein LOC106687419 [Halyomorpha halys]
MRAHLVFVIALTFCLAGAHPRIEDHPDSRSSNEYGKGRSLESDEQHRQDDGRLKDDEDERKEPDEHRMKDDEPEVEGRVKETSVRRKHFMDQYYLQSGPVKYEFGHVCEDPDDWEHRYEKRDYDKNSHQGQVKWGDANGDQGEQLWDFNHGGKDSGEDEEEQSEERSKEHRFQKPMKKIQIKEKIVETTSDGKGKSEFRRSKTGSTVYSGNKKEEGNYKEVVTKTKKKNSDIPFLFDPVSFDSVETPRGFSKLDFDFDDHEHDHSFDHDFDIDRMGTFGTDRMDTFGPDMKDDFIPVHLRSFYTGRMGHSDSIGEKSSINQSSENPKGYVTIKQQIRRVDSTPPGPNDSSEGKKKKFSVEEHQQIRRYGFFPTPLLKRSVANFNVGLAMATKDKDMNSAGTKDVEMKDFKIDSGSPITGSLTEEATGKVFKIYGVLVDS